MSKEKKLKQLFEQSMEVGGKAEFRKNWEQSIGITTGDDGIKKFDASKREVDYKDYEIGRVCQALLGNDWRSKFEQNWAQASNMRFEGAGSAVMPGDLPYVSSALDVIAGLANARALERPASPQFIWDKMCSVAEASGEGGFDIIVRPAGNKPNTDLANGEPIPTVQLKGSRVHRNRSMNQGLRTKINLYTVLDDLTSTLYEAVDEVSDQVLNERERKVADCLLGVGGSGNAGHVLMTQDGLQFYPYQAAAATTVSPENGKLIQNFANCVNGDGLGLQDYTCVEKAFAVLYGNRDPFTNLPVTFDMNNMKFFVAPRSVIQAKYIMNAKENWSFNSIGLSAFGKVTTGENPIGGLGFQILSSQIWANRLVDVGIAGSALTNAQADTTHTAGSVASFYLMGHPEKAIKYWQRMPYTVQQVPLSSAEYAEQTVLVQDVRERGQAYWVNPRYVFRGYA